MSPSGSMALDGYRYNSVAGMVGGAVEMKMGGWLPGFCSTRTLYTCVMLLPCVSLTFRLTLCVPSCAAVGVQVTRPAALAVMPAGACGTGGEPVVGMLKVSGSAS